jgi:murein DD-endopeptidase MepM/ murein hydrolase activator NlpD
VFYPQKSAVALKVYFPIGGNMGHGFTSFLAKVWYCVPCLELVFLVGCAQVQSRYHGVREGETAEKIATRYGVKVSDLIAMNERLSQGIRVGDKLYIPFESIPGWNSGDENLNEDPQLALEVDRGDNSSRGISRLAPRFIWPVGGRLTSVFGRRHGSNHDGIDIAAPRGTQVRASRSGHVIYSGNKISGYGNMVIIRHSDSYATVYAHLSKISVSKGQFISRGQLVGKVGATGHATGPHLHFEVREKSHPTDPLAFLPKSAIQYRARR